MNGPGIAAAPELLAALKDLTLLIETRMAILVRDRDELVAALEVACLRCPCAGTACVLDCAHCQRDMSLILRIRRGE